MITIFIILDIIEIINIIVITLSISDFDNETDKIQIICHSMI